MGQLAAELPNWEEEALGSKLAEVQRRSQAVVHMVRLTNQARHTLEKELLARRGTLDDTGLHAMVGGEGECLNSLVGLSRRAY